MNADSYIKEVRLKLTGNLLDLELTDETIMQILNASLRELQRYYCEVLLVMLPYSSCIDLSSYKVNAVTNVYRTDGVSGSSDMSTGDPMTMAQWQMLCGTGNIRFFQDYMYNYMSWNTLQQIRNTISTDLAYRYDKHSKKLYINTSVGTPSYITIEYVPRLENVDEVETDYWIDNLINLTVAQTKIIVGRIRSKFKQSNALWQNDGDQILQEGLQEYRELQEYLRQNTQLFYPVD